MGYFPHALSRLLADYLAHPYAGFMEGVELGRWGYRMWVPGLRALVADGLRPGSVRQTHRVLSLILDAAVQDGRLGRNPARGARLPRPVRKEAMYLSAEQVSAFAEAARPHELTILTLAFTGLRFGELAALKVRRFDAGRKRLNIMESVTEVGSELVWTTPKTHQTRSVPVPAQLAAMLEERCGVSGPTT